MISPTQTIRWLLAVATLTAATLTHAAGAPSHDDLFPVPDTLRPAVGFWTRVYVEIDTKHGFIHDSRHLGVVYETVRVDRSRSHRARSRAVKSRKAAWRDALQRIAAGGAAPASAAEREALAALTTALGREPTKADLRAAASRLRFQLGQRDKFRAGLVRAGAFESQIRSVLRQHGLPEDLAYLPHVESSFNTEARSKSGAAGMWQFMPRTGRRFMTIDAVLDERLDPAEASVAAAKLLRHNHAGLGTWPLALTAYNHGFGGMRRAVRKVGTTDIGAIVDTYRSRSFGFASRNFYAQFVAARAVAGDAQTHFGTLNREPPSRLEVVEMPFYVEVGHVERYLGVDRETLRRLNPALRAIVYSAQKRIPRGYALKLPPDTAFGGVEQWVARIPAEHRHAKQSRSAEHVVRRGETLSGIARLHRTDVRTIVNLNGLKSEHRIWPGQRLELLVARAPVEKRVPVAEPAAASIQVAVHDAAPKPVPTGPDRGPAAATLAEPAPVAAWTEASLPARDALWGAVEDGEILVDAGETIGHFAEWLRISSSQLRRANGLSKQQSIRAGQRLQVDFSRVSEDEFVRRRTAHHEAIEASFLARYRVTGVRQHALRSGESLWVLANRVYRVPDWLVHRYNPQTAGRRLTPGTPIAIPMVEAVRAS